MSLQTARSSQGSYFVPLEWELTQLSFLWLSMRMVCLSRQNKQRVCCGHSTGEKQEYLGIVLGSPYTYKHPLGKLTLVPNCISKPPSPEGLHCYPHCFVSCWEFFTFSSLCPISLLFPLLSLLIGAFTDQGSRCLMTPSSRHHPSGTQE